MWERFRRKKPEREPAPDMTAYWQSPEGRAELTAYFSTEKGQKEFARARAREIAGRQPTLKEAFALDVATYASLMMQPLQVKSGLSLLKEAVGLALKSDAFLSVLLYRVRVRLLVHQVPVVPSVLHRLCMIHAQMNIGDHVVIRPGVYFPHGQVVIDGKVEIGTGTVIAPWVTLGLNGKDLDGPTLGQNVFIGTGAKILGPVQLGQSAWVGANAVVLNDVPSHATAVGIPAKILYDRRNGQKENTSG
jgi:serine O-acetyltransferase